MLPGVAEEEVGGLLGGLMVGVSSHVGVGLHGEADVGMPDPLADHFHSDVLIDVELGKRGLLYERLLHLADGLQVTAAELFIDET